MSNLISALQFVIYTKTTELINMVNYIIIIYITATISPTSLFVTCKCIPIQCHFTQCQSCEILVIYSHIICPTKNVCVNTSSANVVMPGSRQPP